MGCERARGIGMNTLVMVVRPNSVLGSLAWFNADARVLGVVVVYSLREHFN